MPVSARGAVVVTERFHKVAAISPSHLWLLGFPSGSVGKESACKAGERGGLIPGSRRSPGEGNGNPLQYSSLENSMDRGNWQATVPGVVKSWA